MLPFEPRGEEPAEWTLSELLGLVTPPGLAGPAHVDTLGERFARSLLCLIAPLIAAVALARTTRATQTFAFPVACLVLMAIDLAGGAAVKALAPSGTAMALAVPFGIALALALAMAATVMRMQHAVVKPALGRA
jgi:hypothetical protein